MELGGTSVWSTTGHPQVLQWVPRPARRPADPCYHVMLLLEGEAVVVHDGRETALRAGDFYCDDHSRPREIQAGPVTAAGIDVPQALLPLPKDEADLALGRRAASRDGAGALLARFLTQLIQNTRAFRPSDGPRLGTVLNGLVAALFARVARSDPAPPSRAEQGNLVPRVMNFIQQNLAEPELSPRTIATAHGISPSYLHRLFQDEQETVAALIRRQRLERARFDLADPAQDTTPVHVIAARWGFTRATDLTRAFRAAYGIPPTVYRHRSRALGRRIAT
ncbi:helix-turn-helix domain-containing protein [Streptomyces sp. NBC_01462]|uniref:helix-turn-helix domain-containing protein n=1 Tax=Streptomyces sp. NBC_01462 TaxID=2903876 RepID=UPI002E2EBB6D|nr:helix-turn-helix domain-containing protein [Streptomyces sp. NBC_01462]